VVDVGGDEAGVGCAGVERPDCVAVTVCTVVSEAGIRDSAGVVVVAAGWVGI
jgi:hypothetical protein